MSYRIPYDTSLAPPRAPAIVAFMEDFYRTSDTESQHEKYVQSFTEDATLIMGPKQAQGSDGMFAVLSLHGIDRRWTVPAISRLIYSPLPLRNPSITYSCEYILTAPRNPHPPPRPLDTRRLKKTHTNTYLLRRRERDHALRRRQLQTQG